MQVIELDDVRLGDIEVRDAWTVRRSLLGRYRTGGIRAVRKDLQELADSMKAVGLLQPISVTPVAYKRYVLVIGLRRLLAAKLLGWETIQAQIVVRYNDVPPRPLVNPKATALQRDRQVRAQQRWDREHGKGKHGK